MSDTRTAPEIEALREQVIQHLKEPQLSRVLEQFDRYERDCRIRDEFNRLTDDGYTVEQAYRALSDKHHLSERTIRYIVYGT